MIEEFFKISVIVLIASGLCVFLKIYRPEYSFLLALAVSVVIITVVLAKVYPSIKTIRDIYYRSSGNKGNFDILLKALIISYVSGFCGDTCRDHGQTALAQKVEFAGRCAIFVLTVPLLVSILQTALGFINV